MITLRNCRGWLLGWKKGSQWGLLGIGTNLHTLMADITYFEKIGAAKGFRIAHLNVRSLVKKIDQVRILLRDKPVDIFTVSETWLQPHLSTRLVEIDGYEVIRLDRGSGESNRRKGGAF